MALRCWPGCLAQVTKSDGWGDAGAVSRAILGRTVRCKVLGKPDDEACFVDQVWKIEEPFKVEVEGRIYLVDGLADYLLTPITPPPGTELTDTDVPAELVGV